MAIERVQRRLAAIVAADVAGYSRLMGVDEEGTLSAMKSHLRDFINPKIEVCVRSARPCGFSDT